MLDEPQHSEEPCRVVYPAEFNNLCPSALALSRSPFFTYPPTEPYMCPPPPKATRYNSPKNLQPPAPRLCTDIKEAWRGQHGLCNVFDASPFTGL